jgi:tRNA pseudouridine38-40 synthase
MARAVQQVGDGEQDEDWIGGLLAQTTDKAIQPAPAEGLILWDIDCGVTWTSLLPADRSRTHLADLQRHHDLMCRVCHALDEEKK